MTGALLFLAACGGATPRPARVVGISIETVDSMHGDRSMLTIQRSGCFESRGSSSGVSESWTIRGCLPGDEATRWFERADRIALVGDAPRARPHADSYVFLKDDDSSGAPSHEDVEAARHVADLRALVRKLIDGPPGEPSPTPGGFLEVRVRGASLSATGHWSCTSTSVPGELSFEDTSSITVVGLLAEAEAATVLDRVLANVAADGLEPVVEGSSPDVVVRHRDREGALSAAAAAPVVEAWSRESTPLDAACRTP